MHKHLKKKKGAAGIFLMAAILVCVAVVAVSGFMLIRTFLAYKAGTEEYNGLQQYVSSGEADKSTASISLASSSGEIPTEKEAAPVQADFTSLKAINPDVVGWIYIEGVGISYPVVHGTDDDYYLHRTFEKQDNFAGSIFVEAQNSGDFSDPNTIVYGHNMLNKSMFGNLRKLLSDDLYQQYPYFWILTPDGEHKYQIFSLQVTKTESNIYSLFDGRDRKFTDWCGDMAKQSEADLEIPEFTDDSRVVTLSTCVNDSGERFIVQGVMLQ